MHADRGAAGVGDRFDRPVAPAPRAPTPPGSREGRARRAARTATPPLVDLPRAGPPAGRGGGGARPARPWTRCGIRKTCSSRRSAHWCPGPARAGSAPPASLRRSPTHRAGSGAPPDAPSTRTESSRLPAPARAVAPLRAGSSLECTGAASPSQHAASAARAASSRASTEAYPGMPSASSMWGQSHDRSGVPIIRNRPPSYAATQRRNAIQRARVRARLRLPSPTADVHRVSARVHRGGREGEAAAQHHEIGLPLGRAPGFRHPHPMPAARHPRASGRSAPALRTRANPPRSRPSAPTPGSSHGRMVAAAGARAVPRFRPTPDRCGAYPIRAHETTGAGIALGVVHQIARRTGVGEIEPARILDPEPLAEQSALLVGEAALAHSEAHLPRPGRRSRRAETRAHAWRSMPLAMANRVANPSLSLRGSGRDRENREKRHQ